MADNFLQFSMIVPLPTREAEAWCGRSLTELDRLLAESKPNSDQEYDQFLAPVVRGAAQEEWASLDFEWSIAKPQADPRQVGELWIRADDVGTPEHAAAFLQAYLTKFNPTGSLWFSWAYTCSKMRVNEFGGGAVVVTAKRVTFLDVQDWATRRSAPATKRLTTK